MAALLATLDRWRDRAMVLLMLHGGLRPGEVLCLHLADVQYGRRRVIVHYHTDHPKGARTKSRTERVVDLHEPATLEAVSRYVMDERPRDAQTPLIFLVGGHGTKRREPLSYAALVRLFQRRCDALSIRQPWVTPHALRHTHATRMWEGGMRDGVGLDTSVLGPNAAAVRTSWWRLSRRSWVRTASGAVTTSECSSLAA